MNPRQPRIQLLRKINEPLRVLGQRLDDRLVQPYPDRQLHDHRAQAPDRVHTLLLVQPHRLLGDLLRVLAVLLTDLLDLRLQPGHRPTRIDLLPRQRVHRNPHHDGEGDYAKSEVARQDPVQEDQRVEHRPEKQRIPYVDDYAHAWSFAVLLRG